jgi:hypothetical protein
MSSSTAPNLSSSEKEELVHAGNNTEMRKTDITQITGNCN